MKVIILVGNVFIVSQNISGKHIWNFFERRHYLSWLSPSPDHLIFENVQYRWKWLYLSEMCSSVKISDENHFWIFFRRTSNIFENDESDYFCRKCVHSLSNYPGKTYLKIFWTQTLSFVAFTEPWSSNFRERPILMKVIIFVGNVFIVCQNFRRKHIWNFFRRKY